jgi:hypothetical protein
VHEHLIVLVLLFVLAHVLELRQGHRHERSANSLRVATEPSPRRAASVSSVQEVEGKRSIGEA